MGRARSAIARALLPQNIEVGSSGLGGLAHAIRDLEDPAPLAQCRCAEGAAVAAIAFHDDGPRARWGLGAEGPASRGRR
eukprot:1005337-Pyramimonas_sp.AAC.1